MSHITSPTAITLPVAAICRRAREQGIMICIDGPHAVAQIPLELERHRDALRRLVGMRLDPKIRRRVDVSDVVQNVLIDANRRLQDYLQDPSMPFHLWLRHIAKDRIIDAHRRHQAAARRSVDREQPLAAAATLDRSTMEFAAQLCDRELTPAAAVAMQELAQRFGEAITQLTSIFRPPLPSSFGGNRSLIKTPLRKNLWVDSGQIVEFVLFLQFFASFRAFEIWRSDS